MNDVSHGNKLEKDIDDGTNHSMEDDGDQFDTILKQTLT